HDFLVHLEKSDQIKIGKKVFSYFQIGLNFAVRRSYWFIVDVLLTAKKYHILSIFAKIKQKIKQDKAR
ncbi:hypothetical protein AB9F41_34515, partial [Rhizobium leguminosarum]|uniref:hypothetical protein n=1 Tax=Rhizobium leguminosarum TaxID=384 RepID=UPI003F94A906